MNQPDSRKNKSDCEKLRMYLPAYAVGATTAAETARIEMLLPRCPEAAAELADYMALSEGFLLDVEPTMPAPDVKAGLMERLAAEEAGTPPLTLLEKPENTTRRSTTAWALFAAAAALLIITNVYWVSQLQTVQSELALLRSQQQPDVSAVLASNAASVIPMQSLSDESELGTVYLNTTTGTATLYTAALPALDASQTYQLWLLEGETPQSAGIFRVDDSGVAAYSFGAVDGLSNFEAALISVEPAGGSDLPTTNPIAAADLAQS